MRILAILVLKQYYFNFMRKITERSPLVWFEKLKKVMLRIVCGVSTIQITPFGTKIVQCCKKRTKGGLYHYIIIEKSIPMLVLAPRRVKSQNKWTPPSQNCPWKMTFCAKKLFQIQTLIPKNRKAINKNKRRRRCVVGFLLLSKTSSSLMYSVWWFGIKY